VYIIASDEGKMENVCDFFNFLEFRMFFVIKLHDEEKNELVVCYELFVVKRTRDVRTYVVPMIYLFPSFFGNSTYLICTRFFGYTRE